MASKVHVPVNDPEQEGLPPFHYRCRYGHVHEIETICNCDLLEPEGLLGLLKLWYEAFDDDGNLDGYTNEYIKHLQRSTWQRLELLSGIMNELKEEES